MLGFGVAAGEGGRYALEVFDVRGRRVRIVQSGPLLPGKHYRVWDRSDDSGNRLASGMYFVRLKGPRFEQVHKVLILESAP